MLSRQLILLFLTLFLAACDSLVTDVDPSKLPKVESKLVVQCFISPQATRTNVVVTESNPIFAEPSLKGGVIPNAIVKLSDGTKEVIVPFDTANQLYSIVKEAFIVAPGKTYSLSVTDGPRTVTATCTVPAKAVLPDTYKIDTAYSGNATYPDTALRLKMTWNDIAGETNYYRVRASVEVEHNFLDVDGSEPKEKRVRDRINFRWDDTIGRNDFRSDVNLDGTVFNSPIGRAELPGVASYGFGNNVNYTVYPKNKIISVTMEIYNTDENYFKYHRSLQTRGDADNPFVEPSLIYTNIEGGLGVFGSYNAGQLVYRPK